MLLKKICYIHSNFLGLHLVVYHLLLSANLGYTNGIIIIIIITFY